MSTCTTTYSPALARLAPAVPLSAAGAGVDAGLIGPFRLTFTDSALLSAPAGGLVDVDGAEITGPIQPDTSFYLRAQPRTTSSTVTMTVPGDAGGFGGRVLTGVALDKAANRFTPLALAVPANLVVDFQISWGR